MSLVVQKYGGKCLANIESVKRVASRVAELRGSGKSVIVVVSAMGQSTDNLLSMAYQVSAKPNRRELDMLLTTGERVSMTLLSMALHDLGCKAISYTGSQAGVMTDESHSSARIIDIKPIRIDDSLKRGEVVVLAGFQGVSPLTKEVTTLGRGGSDTTAVAMAAHFKAERCEILKDVDGIASADPKIVDRTKLYKNLSYEIVSDMCFWGAKVLHYRSIELAKKEHVPLFVGSASQLNQGTLIVPEEEMFEKPKVVSVNSHAFVEHIRIDTPDTAKSFQILSTFAQEHSLPTPQILATVQEKDHTRLMITGEKETLQAFLKAAGKTFPTLRPTASSVTVSGYGCTSAEWITHWLARLSTAGVVVEKVLTSPLSASVLVAPDMREKALQISSDGV